MVGLSIVVSKRLEPQAFQGQWRRSDKRSVGLMCESGRIFNSTNKINCSFFQPASSTHDLLVYGVHIRRPESSSRHNLLTLVTVNWQSYIIKHGYDLLLVHSNVLSAYFVNSSLHWNKVVLLRELLWHTTYEYFMYLDSDAAFLNASRSPSLHAYTRMMQESDSSLLISNHASRSHHARINCTTEYNLNTSIIKGAALLDERVSQWHSCSPNTGVFLVKNDERAKHIVEEWFKSWTLSNAGTFKCGNGGFLNDQGGFNLVVTPHFINKGLTILPGPAMNTQDGEFVGHYLGRHEDEKIAELLSFMSTD